MPNSPKKRGRPVGSTKEPKVVITVRVLPESAAWIKSQPHQGQAVDRLVSGIAGLRLGPETVQRGLTAL